jgi:hypothetical protein
MKERMSTDQDRLHRALAAIDEANQDDPNTIEIDGEAVARELLYGQRMSARLDAFAPNAPELVRVAVRAQHVCRWTIPRADYPDGRAGYKRWRSELARRHADIAGRIMASAGYGDDEIARVADLLQKKRLRHDAEVQLLEDVACLVFLEHYFDDFAAKHPRDKVIDIVQKTWRKMSEEGQAAALQLPLTDSALDLVKEALGV